MPSEVEHLELPSEFSSAIGAVVIRWNHLEQVINLFLIYLLGKSVYEERSHIVLAHMAFPQKLDALSALSKEARKVPEHAALAADLEKIFPLLGTAQKARNQIIHSIWGMHKGRVKRASISARGTFKFSWEEAPLKDIEHALKSIEDARKKLYALSSPEWLKSIQSQKGDNI